ncbi:hypothetical protein DFH08DRAFT_676586, partial [Mycena albidolilacea]
SWTSTIYTFYTGDIHIEYCDGKLHHVFICTEQGCGHHVLRNQTTKDHNLTKNLKKHTNKCWGSNTVDAAAHIGHLNKARDLLVTLKGVKNQCLTDIFKHHTPGSNLNSFSHHLRPFVIAADCGLHYLMKSGHSTMWIPSPSTIARDVKLLFKRTRERIWQHLDVHISQTLPPSLRLCLYFLLLPFPHCLHHFLRCTDRLLDSGEEILF